MCPQSVKPDYLCCNCGTLNPSTTMCTTCNILGTTSCLRCKQSLASGRRPDATRDAAALTELVAAARTGGMRQYKAQQARAPSIGSVNPSRTRRTPTSPAADNCVDDDS